MVRFSDWAAVLLGVLLVGACRDQPPEPSGQNSSPLFEDAPTLETPPQEAIAPPNQEGPPPPPSSAFLALLPPDQTAAIQALGVPIVVPTDIPTGFAVDRVEVTQNDRFPSYQILYRDGSDRCFVVEYAGAGIGDIPATEYRTPINPPLFGENEYGLNYGNYVDPGLQAQFPEPELASDWLMQANGFYRLAGAAYINNTFSLEQPCQDITPEEAVQIVESLALITDEIFGDG